MGFFGGSGDVSVTIDGDSGGAQNAIQQATQSLKNLTDQMRYSSQATSVFGQAGASSALAWLNSSSSAKDYTQRLSYLQAQLAYTKLAQDQTADSATGYRFTMQSLGNDLLNNLGPFGATVITLNSLLGVFGQLGGAVLNVVGSIGSFVENLAQVATSDAWQAIQYGADQVERLGQAMFDLNNQTEKNVNTWQFIYGGQANARDLAAWTQTFSMQIPYTRQDLMNAVTALGRTGMTEAEVKRYMPTVADLGTLNPNLDLTSIAFAIQGAQHGYTRMLRYELGINPEDLRKYGLAIDNHGHITDASTLMPALQRYSQARGIGGAAQRTATGTWWGAASSFEDRIQNFLLAAGGTQANGEISKGSFFANLKQGLTDLNAWIDAHQKPIKWVADIVAELYGNGVKAGRNGLEAFLEALHKTGIDTMLLRDLSEFAKWLGDPNTQAGAREVGGLVGQLGGIAGLDLRGVFGSLWQGLTSTGIGQTLLDDLRGAIKWLSDPQNQQGLQKTGYILGEMIGGSLQAISNSLGGMVTNGTALMKQLRPEDMALIAGVFAEIAWSIESAANAMSLLANDTLGFVHLMEDVKAGNWSAAGKDVQQMQQYFRDFLNQEGNSFGNWTNFDAQMQIAMMQWQKQHGIPTTGGGGHLGHLGHHHITDSSGITLPEHGRKAGMLMMRPLTDSVTTAMVGDLNNMTRAGQQIMGQLSDALINASTGTMSQLGQQIATVIANAVEAHVASQMRLHAEHGTLATQVPGGYGRFAFGGGRAPW